MVHKSKKKNNRNNKNKHKNAAKLQDIEHQATVENEDESEHGENVPGEEDTTNKRQFDDNDSDTEEQPRRKKKKKLSVPADSLDKKGKKSIRQMKREKFAERQAEATAMAKNQLKSECINYLSQWKHNKQNWKFMKAKQVWLYKNKFSALIPDEHWPLLLEYFESAQGNIRNMLLEDANKIIHLMDEWTEKHNNVEEKDDTSSELNKPDDTSYKRARDLIQCLQE